MQVQDNQVFAAVEAGEREIKRWRLIVGPKDRYIIALRDLMDLTDIGVEAHNTETRYEKMDFASSAKAQEYIHWRGMKAALESL